ncbi:A-kinase-interacting protein 1 [Aplochiton taeniatus]
MANQAWLESSLRRSAILGQEVLERASRRSVDWASNSNPSQTPIEDGNQSEALLSDEDFHIEVSPGTYAITAGTADSRQQTRLVSIKAGESVNLTFDL